MTGPDDKPSREDAAYAAIGAYARRHAFEIALGAPFLLLILLLPDAGFAGFILLLVVYLCEAIAYAGLQRRRGVRPLSDPEASLRAGARWGWRLAVVFVFAIGTLILNAAVARFGR